MSNKYMLTIQHEFQKVAYIEFKSDSDDQAKQAGEDIFANYKGVSSLDGRYYPTSANFSGVKPPIKSHHVSKWVLSDTAVNGWGELSGGYWSSI